MANNEDFTEEEINNATIVLDALQTAVATGRETIRQLTLRIALEADNADFREQLQAADQRLRFLRECRELTLAEHAQEVKTCRVQRRDKADSVLTLFFM